ncbi:hypothetical protein POM88_016823 [Heracleum sosnowskyi]|uniref:Replication protein A 70 kDa DNA-binding subunit B/D first OB fold domain-containing protein n=1 Tax=Heracleum sosnowskyi TaxID=360622 RepID=A0AAD8IRD7_9APIA|nr:hypothetical protein POM88_016823 [Heracleum sosnowskyi]
MDLKKPGYSPPATMMFSQLHPGINEATIVVRVTRAWKGVSAYDSTEMVANFILLDEEDGQVHAVTSPEQMHTIWPKLCEDLLYYITNFTFATFVMKWKPVQSDRVLLLNRETKIENCCKGNNISNLKFDLQMLATIIAHPKSVDILIDVCGVLLNIDDKQSTTNDIDKLHITIMDNRPMETFMADATGCTGEFIIQPREIAQLIGVSPLQLVCATKDQVQRKPQENNWADTTNLKKERQNNKYNIGVKEVLAATYYLISTFSIAFEQHFIQWRDLVLPKGLIRSNREFQILSSMARYVCCQIGTIFYSLLLPSL